MWTKETVWITRTILVFDFERISFSASNQWLSKSNHYCRWSKTRLIPLCWNFQAYLGSIRVVSCSTLSTQRREHVKRYWTSRCAQALCLPQINVPNVSTPVAWDTPRWSEILLKKPLIRSFNWILFDSVLLQIQLPCYPAALRVCL